MTVVSSTQLSVALAIAATANPGPRDVTVTNPGGQTVTRAGGVTVLPPPPAISLAFLGKLRDKEGQGNGAFSADGALDGSFRVTVQGGGWPRTVTRLELQIGSGAWREKAEISEVAVAFKKKRDGALLNAGTGTVSCGVADGRACFAVAL